MPVISTDTFSLILFLFLSTVAAEAAAIAAVSTVSAESAAVTTGVSAHHRRYVITVLPAITGTVG